MNSVLSLRVIKAIYRPDRPYLNPTDKEIKGSAFIIDIEKGLVVTNAHIVGNAISIIGRLPILGRRDISLELLGICREKDLAICKILDLSLVTSAFSKGDLNKLNLKFGDSMEVKAEDIVTALGYPLDSSNIKITNGLVSGFEILDDNKTLNEIEDSFLRSPSYIQISAPINHGNSGGPLLNRKGEVIGIITSGYPEAQNIGYAIPSRTFLAIYNELINNQVVDLPTLGLEWSRTNRELMKKQTGTSSTYGIYVRKIYPDSCFDLLEKGDIIRRIDYLDMFWDERGNSKSPFSLDSLKLNGVLVTIFLDRFGLTTKICKLKNPDESDDAKIEFEKILTERKMELSEVMDMVPIGTDITINLCRAGSWYKLKSKYISTPSERIPRVYPRITPYQYEIFAGLCLTNLDSSHFEIFENLSSFEQDPINRYRRYVIIVQVFSESSAGKSQILKAGHLIKSILAYDKNLELIADSNRIISSLDDVHHILHLRPTQLQITTTDDSTFLISTSTISKEDKDIISNYKINHKYLL